MVRKFAGKTPSRKQIWRPTDASVIQTTQSAKDAKLEKRKQQREARKAPPKAKVDPSERDIDEATGWQVVPKHEILRLPPPKPPVVPKEQRGLSKKTKMTPYVIQSTGKEIEKMRTPRWEKQLNQANKIEVRPEDDAIILRFDREEKKLEQQRKKQEAQKKQAGQAKGTSKTGKKRAREDDADDAIEETTQPSKRRRTHGLPFKKGNTIEVVGYDISIARRAVVVKKDSTLMTMSFADVPRNLTEEGLDKLIGKTFTVLIVSVEKISGEIVASVSGVEEHVATRQYTPAPTPAAGDIVLAYALLIHKQHLVAIVHGVRPDYLVRIRGTHSVAVKTCTAMKLRLNDKNPKSATPLGTVSRSRSTKANPPKPVYRRTDTGEAIRARKQRHSKRKI